MLTRMASAAKLVGLTVALVLSGCKGAEVPAELSVRDPALRVSLRLRARGAQVYRCEAAKTSAPPSVWTLVGPDATLYDDRDAPVGKHSAGPTWELTGDGSKVTGVVQAMAVVAADASPWLLLAVATNAGKGALASTRFIQRIETRGGVAPSAGCDPTHEGSETRVDYTATYVFWG